MFVFLWYNDRAEWQNESSPRSLVRPRAPRLTPWEAASCSDRTTRKMNTKSREPCRSFRLFAFPQSLPFSAPLAPPLGEGKGRGGLGGAEANRSHRTTVSSYLIKRTECHQMVHFSQTKKGLLYNAKATYYPSADGGLRLARVQVFSSPKFSEGCFDLNDQKPKKTEKTERFLEEPNPENVRRAARRARREAFDLIMCNPDLDVFVTVTYAPEKVSDKTSYDECYEKLRVWLSNGVQRRGLKYLCVPELTKAGDIHFHALMNQSALKLTEARHPETGRLIKQHGDQVYNVENWTCGFSTAQIIKQRADGEDERLAVSKYIFKYMGKNLGAKIGGRYVLSGGDLAEPITVCGDGVWSFAGAEDIAAARDCYSTEIEGAGKYWEYNFL